MKSLRFAMAAVLMSLCMTVAFAQSDAPKPSAAPVPSEAQKAFSTLKSLGGEWEGAFTTDMPEAIKVKMGADKMNPKIHISLRVTSRGNALVHEMQEPGTPLDATKYDHPVTMMYVDGDQLNLIHYCDAGNRPRMIGKASPDGKTVEFEFADISGRNQKEHMHHSVFTVIDPDHHTEDWTFMMGDMAIHAHGDLHRINTAATTASK
jgi:hypothetical protein